jgi:hypothetical protein
MGRPWSAHPWAVCLIFNHPACCPLIGQPVPGAARDMVRSGEVDHRGWPIRRAQRRRGCSDHCPRLARTHPLPIFEPRCAHRGGHARGLRGFTRASPSRRRRWAGFARLGLIGPRHWRLVWACQQEWPRLPPALDLGHHLGSAILFEFGPEFCAPILRRYVWLRILRLA